MKRVFVVGTARTAVGTFGGSLAKTTVCDLAVHVSRAAIDRAGLNPMDVESSIFGHVINTEPRDAYLSRVAAIDAGLSNSAQAMNVNRLCGSGLQAIVSGLQSIRSGDVDVVLVGGAECMSRSPYTVRNMRFGHKMGDAQIVDTLTGTLSDPFGHGHMGITAENVAEEHNISREEQDRFAAESHARATRAIESGFFKDQIVPIEVGSRRDRRIFDRDEHVQTDVSQASLSELRAVFKTDGSVTAGNASGINDGAAALVLMSERALEKHNVTPLAEIVCYSHAGVASEVMGLGPIPAVRRLSERSGIAVQDFDVVESNEAFAAQACAVTQALELDPAKVNPNGGAVALGHPIGATGAIIAIKTIAELHRTKAKLGLATMCIGGGQGIAVVFERV